MLISNFITNYQNDYDFQFTTIRVTRFNFMSLPLSTYLMSAPQNVQNNSSRFFPLNVHKSTCATAPFSKLSFQRFPRNFLNSRIFHARFRPHRHINLAPFSGVFTILRLPKPNPHIQAFTRIRLSSQIPPRFS